MCVILCDDQVEVCDISVKSSDCEGESAGNRSPWQPCL